METRTLAIFDFDGTMIRGDSIVAFVRMGVRRGLMRWPQCAALIAQAVPYALGLLKAEAYKEKALRFYFRLPPTQRQALDEMFVRDELLPRVYPAALERLEVHRKEGCLCLLVSASTEHYMRFVAKALGFDGLICTQLDGTGRVLFNCKGKNKITGILNNLTQWNVLPDWKSSYAYGNSVSDLPILQKCGRGVMVNPKGKLRRAAPGMAMENWRSSRN